MIGFIHHPNFSIFKRKDLRQAIDGGLTCSLCELAKKGTQPRIKSHTDKFGIIGKRIGPRLLSRMPPSEAFGQIELLAKNRTKLTPQEAKKRNDFPRYVLVLP